MINQQEEIRYKIIYYGPGLAGKSTNINYLYKNIAPERKSKISSYIIDNAHFVSFDYNPEIKINDKMVTFLIMGYIGNIFSLEAEMKVLKDVNGIIFVVDSQSERL